MTASRKARGGSMADEEEVVDPAGGAEGEEPPPYWVEVWNDYDPSMRFVSIFPVGEREGAVASSVAYYIIEPGKHTGLHSDNVEEIVFVAEGEGEVFSIGGTRRARGRQVLRLPGGNRPRHLRAGRRCHAAPLVLPDHRDPQHVPAGDLPGRRQHPELEAPDADPDRARPEQPARGLPVLARGARRWPRPARRSASSAGPSS